MKPMALRWHASELIDPLGTRASRVAGMARWRRRYVAQRRVTRYDSLLDGWHGRRSPWALVRLFRRTSRMVDRVMRTTP